MKCDKCDQIIRYIKCICCGKILRDGTIDAARRYCTKCYSNSISWTARDIKKVELEW